uniref:Si:dkeyp-106c3.2 n=3 Tax=Nothobranchius TaxID=28779 RepID=A0A1A8AIZ1_NOTFU
MLTAGRKRREDVWSHFSYDNIATKTTCRECGLSFRGKNTTNLKRHLQNGHFAIFSEVNPLKCCTRDDPKSNIQANKTVSTLSCWDKNSEVPYFHDYNVCY